MIVTRRQFVQQVPVFSLGALGGAGSEKPPSYLRGYEQQYRQNPRRAALEWFKNARFGLFIHYGLYSLLGRGEWVMFYDKIRPAEYARLQDQFTASKFDAEFICRLAVEAGMRYITLVTKHCDSFCLWNTKQTDFNSVNSPAKRDLVKEMAEACRKNGLGFFVFYEHGFDWRHPHGPAPWDWKAKAVRPAYDPPDAWYAPRESYDFGKYLDYVTAQITELTGNYGPLAGVWLDGAGVPHSGDRSKFRLPELYSLIRGRQPQTLISYKFGVNGDEDFLAPELPQVKLIQDRGAKPAEICRTLEPRWWGYDRAAEGKHHTADEVMEMAAECAQYNANLLLNTGPLPDGSIPPEDVRTLREFGRRVRAKG